MSISTNASDYENDNTTEGLWAMKAMEHAEVYYNLITSVDPCKLRLTPHDDEIIREFEKDFPNFKLDIIEDEVMKSEKSKTKWRPFCNHFDGTVKDFNYGTLLRLDATGEYNEKNTIFVTRIQFLAIEIARNRKGINQKVFTDAKNKRQNAISNEVQS